MNPIMYRKVLLTRKRRFVDLLKARESFMNPRFIKTLQQLLYRLQAKVFEMYPSLRCRQSSVMTTFTDVPNSTRASLQQAATDEDSKKRIGSGFGRAARSWSKQNKNANKEITLTYNNTTTTTTPVTQSPFPSPLIRWMQRI